MSFRLFYEKSEDFEVVDDYQVYIDNNFDLEIDEEIKKELEEIEFDDLDETLVCEGKSPRQKRQIARAKRSAVKAATAGKFYNMSLKDRAKFLSRYEFKKITPTQGIFLPRKTPIPQLKLFRKLKKASKVLKKFSRIRTKGKQSKKRTKGKF